ncbi:MAG TPA: hypothetical protein VF278_10505 [Pirellulales bacterium]
MIANSLFTALIGSELGLLGMAMPLATGRSTTRGKRMFAVAAITLWLWALTIGVMMSAKPVPPPFILLLAPAVSFAAVAFGAIMWALGIWLVREQDDCRRHSQPLRFTLRHVFVLTAAVGALLAIGRICRESRFQASYTSPVFYLAVLLVVALTTAGIVGVAVWASLSRGLAWHRVPIAIGMATVAGMLPGYYFAVSLIGCAILAAVATALSILSATTLLVVRGCGYRLTRVSSFSQSWPIA